MLTRTDMSCCYPQDPGSEHSQKSILSGGINDCVHQTTSKTPHGWWMLIVSLQSKSFPGASAWLKLNHIESSMGPSSVIKINCHLQFLQTTLSNKQLGLRLRPTKKKTDSKSHLGRTNWRLRKCPVSRAMPKALSRQLLVKNRRPGHVRRIAHEYVEVCGWENRWMCRVWVWDNKRYCDGLPPDFHSVPDIGYGGVPNWGWLRFNNCYIYCISWPEEISITDEPPRKAAGSTQRIHSFFNHIYI